MCRDGSRAIKRKCSKKRENNKITPSDEETPPPRTSGRKCTPSARLKDCHEEYF